MTAPQGTQEWLQARVGLLTASRFADATSTTLKGQPTEARTRYLLEIVTERLTGRPTEHFFSTAMKWGKDHEDAAVELYVDRRITQVRRDGFLIHPSVPYAGCSPDGLVDVTGGVEVKCPFDSSRHIATWLNGMPKEHMAQVQGAMWVTGRAWWDFVSYDPRMPEALDLYIERIHRDGAYIDQLASNLAKAWLDVLTLEGQLIERAQKQSQLLGYPEPEWPSTDLERKLALSVALAREEQANE